MNKRTDKDSLKVIHDDKLLIFLKNIEMYEPVTNEEVKCKFCREVISLENINGVFPEDNQIKISCDKPECVIALSNYLNDHDV